MATGLDIKIANDNLTQTGKLSITEYKTAFSHKQIINNNANVFNTITNGTGSATYNSGESSTTLSVSANADYVIKQSLQRACYEPGKSIQILLTGYFTNSVDANTSVRWGGFSGSTSAPYNTYDGVFFSRESGASPSAATDYYVNVFRSGTQIAKVSRNNWNDKLDGTGVSGYNIDFTKSQIFVIQYKWLGVGQIQFGILDGKNFIVCHTVLFSNVQNKISFSNPNIPVRFEARSTGGSASFTQICSLIESEAISKMPFEFAFKNSLIITPGTGAATIYGLCAIRQSNTGIGGNILVDSFSVSGLANISTVQLILNPTIAGTPTWNTISGSTLEYSQLVLANTLTGGRVIESKCSGGTETSVSSTSIYSLGSQINGTSDVIVLGVIKESGNANDTYIGSMTIHEFI